MSQPSPLVKTLRLYGVRVPAGEYERLKRIADALWPLAFSSVPKVRAKSVPKVRAKKEAVIVAKHAILEFLERVETI